MSSPETRSPPSLIPTSVSSLQQNSHTGSRSSNKKTMYYPQDHIDNNKSYLIPSIRRPRAETMPTTINSIDTSDNHFMDSTWLNHPSTPTTDQLLKGDNNNTIMSTFASLGLDESPSTIHTSHSYSSLHTLSENQQWYQDPYHRPRAQSAVDHQQPENLIPSIWNKPTFSRPFLRNSNSSADLLEMIARQRRVNSPNTEDMDTHWTGDIESSYEQSMYISDKPSKILCLGQLDLNAQSSTELYTIFSKLGVLVENIRISPERKIAFIQYSTVEEAMKAKDAFANKMGNRLYPHSLQPVQVGFGASLYSTSTTPSTDQEPTRALWVGNIPMNTTQATLGPIFSTFGAIESVRVLSNKNCAFINYYAQEDAINAKKKLSNKEIMGKGTGAVKIGYAKPARGMTETEVVPPQQTNKWMEEQQQMMVYMNTNVISAVVTERKLIMQDFGQDESDGPIFDVLHFPLNYHHSIPAAPELGQTRKVEISRLRDIRKRLDAGTVMMNELEVIAIECIDELVELCSDYIGNTVIQRLFERCSEVTKSMMLEKVAPYLASIGVHKNGTWAAQKIIDTARLPTQISLICAHIKPYVPALLLDQFGNYVVQCCLGLGPTRNQFIFDAIVDSCWEIAQGRFGARAVRATLESPHVTKRQQKYVAASLVQHALLLATNANGALLLIWFLDTSGIPGRYRVLAPRLLPHLAKLCTHKLASLTVLKLVNQRQEPEARAMILDALFFSKQHDLIEEVLKDQVHGVSLIQKILSSSYIELRDRQRIAERVKQYLVKLKIQHVQGYKRLMEEINMVMTDSTPGITNQYPISPGLAAALQATYLSTNEDDDTMMNFYAAAAAAAVAAVTSTPSSSTISASMNEKNK